MTSSGTTSSVNPKDRLLKTEVLFTVYHAFCIKLSLHSVTFKKTVLPKLFRLREKLEKDLKQSHHEYLLAILGTTLPPSFKSIKI